VVRLRQGEIQDVTAWIPKSDLGELPTSNILAKDKSELRNLQKSIEIHDTVRMQDAGILWISMDS